MDIQYLLFLQNLRGAIGTILTPILYLISEFAISGLTVVIAIIYWCFDKDLGRRSFMNFACTNAINDNLKITAHVYRPWIRDSRVIPYEKGFRSATGYSFPSGHTSTATSLYGTLVWQLRNKKRWISILCVLLILLTGFSRNYMGYHTPQDVCVAMLISVVVIFINTKFLYPILVERKNAELYFMIGAIVLGILLILYICFKSYPMDYVDGALLVDPKLMQIDAFKATARMLAFFIGYFIEARFAKFEIPETKNGKLKTIIVGFVIFLFIYAILEKILLLFLPLALAKPIKSFMEIFFIVGLHPLIVNFMKEKNWIV